MIEVIAKKAKLKSDHWPRKVPYNKTNWQTDRQSQYNFDFDFDFGSS
jgi:hypothetical protein